MKKSLRNIGMWLKRQFNKAQFRIRNIEVDLNHPSLIKKKEEAEKLLKPSKKLQTR